MSIHFFTHQGTLGYWGNVGEKSGGNLFSNWKRVVFVVFMTAIFLFLFVFL